MPRSGINYILIPCMAASTMIAFQHAARGQEPEAFYKGRTVTMLIGYGPGGSYDLYGRLVARHIGRHIPGEPNIVPQNRPGANSYVAANYMYSVAPRDGATLGIVTQQVALDESLGTTAVQYKSAEFGWIGRITSNIGLIVSGSTSRARTIQDTKKFDVPIAVAGDNTPLVLNNLAGTRFRIIAGYPSSNASMLAMERGEVDSTFTSWNAIKTTKQDWLRNKTINLIVQLAPYRHADLPDVPDMVSLGETREQKQILALYGSVATIGRSIFTTPGVPPERLKTLRDAFMRMTRDPALLAEIEQTKAELDPMPGEELQKIVANASFLPPDLRDQARQALNSK